MLVGVGLGSAGAVAEFPLAWPLPVRRSVCDRQPEPVYTQCPQRVVTAICKSSSFEPTSGGLSIRERSRTCASRWPPLQSSTRNRARNYVGVPSGQLRMETGTGAVRPQTRWTIRAHGFCRLSYRRKSPLILDRVILHPTLSEVHNP